jgi:CRP-like cAMP-binding protein
MSQTQKISEELLETLGAHALLGRLPPDLRELLLERSRVRDLMPAEAICREGFGPTSWFLMLGGRARVTRTRPDGGQELLAHLLPGALFGAVGLLCGQRRAATVAATEPSSVLEIPVELLQRESDETSPRLALELREVLALSLTAQLRTMNRRLYRLGQNLLGESGSNLTNLPAVNGWLLPNH